MINRNILNRSMFADGDEVFVPTGQNPYPTGSSEDNYVARETNTSLDDNTLAVLSQDVIKELGELGIDATNKTTKQLENEIDSYISREKRRLFFDPTDPLDYASAALTGTGIAAGAGIGIKALKTGVKGKQTAEKISKLQTIKNLLNPIKTNPGKVTPATFGVNVGNTTKTIKPLQSSFYGVTGLDIVDPDDETNLNKAEGIDVAKTTQEELDKLQVSKSKKTEAEKIKIIEKKEIEKQIQNAQNEIFKAEKKDTKNLEEYQKRKGQKRQRNLDIFLESMSASMAGTNNLADGLAIGAANAAKAVGDADEAEDLAFATFLEKQKAGKEVTPTEKSKIAEQYSDSIKHLDNMEFILGQVNDLEEMVSTGKVTGFIGLTGRVLGKIKGFTGFGDEVIMDATKSAQILDFIRSQLIKELLNESGRTISNLDRQLIDQITGDIADIGSGEGAIAESIARVKDRIRTAVTQSQNNVSFIDAEYGESIPSLQIYRKGYGQRNQTTPSDSQETEVVVTADDVID